MSRQFLFSLLAFCFIDSALAVDKVTLTYGWKPGIYVKVEGFQRQQKFIGDQSRGGYQGSMSYIMSTQAHDDGILIDYLDIQSSIESEDAAFQGWMKTYMEMLTSAMPSYIINGEGEMAGARGVPEFRQTMLDGMETLLKDAPPAQKQQVLAGVSQALSEEMLNSKLADEWNMVVGQWLGAELEDDGVYEAEFETPMPALGNQPVRTVASYEFVGRVNCDSSDKAASCAKLLFHAETDPVSVTEMLRKMIPEGQPVPDFKMSIVHDLELVTDPDTLLPYYVRQVKNTSSPMETPEGMATIRQVEESEYRYLYVMGNK